LANITLTDVARRADVSVSTASRALNANPKINADTAERVRKAAAELGYMPNLQAKALSKQRTGNIGLLIANPVGSSIHSDEFFMAVLAGASRTIEKNGLNLVVSTTDGVYRGQAALPPMVAERRVDGIIAGGIPMEDSFVRALARCGLPVVFIGRYLDRDYLNTVTPDNEEAGRLAAEHLIGLGHTDLVVLSGQLEINTFKDRFHGVELAVQAAPRAIRVRSVLSPSFDEQAGYGLTSQLLSNDDSRQTAMLGLTDWLALGAMRALRERELSVPGDVSVIGMSDIAPAAVSAPPLSTVRTSSSSLGMLAARLVLDLLAHELEGPVRVVLPPQLVARSSCAAPRPR